MEGQTDSISTSSAGLQSSEIEKTWWLAQNKTTVHPNGALIIVAMRVSKV